MDYHKSIKYLEKFWKFGIKLGLERINHLLELLDHPETEFRAIHIGGTNGKGSVAAILSSILFQAGYKVGLYTSPHLIDYTERIKINNQDIDSNTFARYLTKIRKIIGEKWTLKELPTEFEILTALAFLIFAEKRIEIAVIEVGLGGRLDATNVVEPLVSVITNVDYDHTEILGEDLKKIAYEKAGIVKRGVPLVTAEGKKELLEVIRERCVGLRSKIIRVSEDQWGEYQGIRISDLPLIGEHQKINAKIALEVIRPLNKKGYRISKKAIKNGLRRVKWPGRFEVISKKPLIILDGAHNPAAAEVLKKTLMKYLNGKPLTLILGILAYKDIPRIISILAPIADLIVATKSKHPLAASPKKIAGLAKKYGLEVKIADSIKEALKIALGRKMPICVTGSLFTVGEARKLLIDEKVRLL